MDAPDIVTRKEIKEERRARIESASGTRAPMTAQPVWENFNGPDRISNS